MLRTALILMTTALLLKSCSTGFTVTFESSEAGGHTHEISISCDQLNTLLTDPTVLIASTERTDSFDSHTHSITVTQADINTMTLAEPLEMTSTSAFGHTHTFSLSPC